MFATAWMNLDGISLSEVRTHTQMKKHKTETESSTQRTNKWLLGEREQKSLSETSDRDQEVQTQN